MLNDLFLKARSTIGSDQTRIMTYIKWIIVAGVLFLSLVISILPNPMMILYVLMGFIGITAALIFLKSPQLGLAALVFGSMFIPTPLNIGPEGALNTAILMVALLIVLWLLDMLARRRQIYLVYSRTVPPLLVLIAIVLVAMINGQLNYYSLANLASLFAQVSGAGVFVLSVGAYLLAANQIQDLTWLKRITWLFILLASFYIFARLNHRTEILIRPLYQYGSDASLFWLWLVTLGTSQALFNHKLAVRWRVILGILLAATFYVAMGQAYEWKSGWLPAVASVGVMIFVGYPRLRVPLIILGAGLAGPKLLEVGDFFIGGEDYSIQTRFEAWRLVFEIVKANPIIGLGMSNYYWYTPLFPIMGYAVTYNSHNNFIDILAQTGIVGLLCFLWFVWEVGWLSWKLKDHVPSGFPRAYVIGVLGGLVGTMVAAMLGDWVLPFVYNVGLVGFRSSMFGWLFLGGIVVIEKLYRPDGKSQASPDYSR